MGMLGLNAFAIDAGGDESSLEVDGRTSETQHRRDENACVDCGQPLCCEIDLVGSRTLLLPIAHRCSA